MMIKNNITRTYPSHIRICNYTDQHIYIADYTEQTRLNPPQRSVEIFVQNPPTDIDYFFLINDVRLQIGNIIFNNNSFTNSNGTPKTQCEAVVFPEASDNTSWISFIELKYSSNRYNNTNNLQKAIKQLYKTRSYYKDKGIFTHSNICYLIASLPLQKEPYTHFYLSPAKLLVLKSKHNVILRFTSIGNIINHQIIQFD